MRQSVPVIVLTYAHAGAVLASGDAHPLSCLRVRYEDLAAGPGLAGREIGEFLGLAERWPALPGLPGDGVRDLTGAEVPGCGAGLPADSCRGRCWRR